jgi:hypothetical protein
MRTSIKPRLVTGAVALVLAVAAAVANSTTAQITLRPDQIVDPSQVKKVQCRDVREFTNGPNVFVSCVKQDGSSIPLLIAPSSPQEVYGVIQKNALVLAYMQMMVTNPRAAQQVTLEIDYVSKKENWQPPDSNPMNHVQQVRLK